MEKIRVSKEARKALNEEYGTSNVSRALNYRSNSFQCRHIRRRALADYGGEHLVVKEYKY
jgi:hypothetical protein